jgi:hypothetical protein
VRPFSSVERVDLSSKVLFFVVFADIRRAKNPRVCGVLLMEAYRAVRYVREFGFDLGGSHAVAGWCAASV